MIKKAAKEAAVLVLAAIALGMVVYAVRPDKIATRPALDTSGEAAAAGESGVSMISIDEANRLYREKKALFADARHRVDFDAGHIDGAVSLPVTESALWLDDFLAATDPETVIVTYCDGKNCHLAPELAEMLYFNGFDHVYYLENGWTRWHERGYPVD